MCSIGEKGSSACKTVPFHAEICYPVLKIFSVRTNWNFFSTDGNGIITLLLKTEAKTDFCRFSERAFPGIPHSL